MKKSKKQMQGKSGTGKSTFIFNEIKEKINGDSKIYIITPEQFSFTAERELLNTVGVGAALNAEVLTFNRMAYRSSKTISITCRACYCIG